MKELLDVYSLNETKVHPKIFDIIMQKCIEAISLQKTETFIVYQLPNVIIGHDYDLKQCMKYLIKRFEEKSYIVLPVSKNMLCIDWTVSKEKMIRKKISKIIKDNPDADITLQIT